MNGKWFSLLVLFYHIEKSKSLIYTEKLIFVGDPIGKWEGLSLLTCATDINSDMMTIFRWNEGKCQVYANPCNDTSYLKLEKVFIHPKIIKRVLAIQSSARFQLLVNVQSYPYLNDTSYLNIKDIRHTEVVLRYGPDDKAILVASTIDNSRALIFAKYKYISQLKSDNYGEFTMNVMRWLTRGQCLNIQNCTFTHSELSHYRDRKGVVLLSKSGFTELEIYKKIKEGYWGFLTGQMDWPDKEQEKTMKQTANHFGVCVFNSKDKNDYNLSVDDKCIEYKVVIKNQCN